jgi:adenosylcobinamide kinase/adenosylcobinamide-phosphate guanylyltransferase
VKELVLGGARSGKSAWAQQRARESGLNVVLIATAIAGDTEMAERIARHRSDRPREWTVIEEPVALAHALECHASGDRCVIVDCLTLWMANLLCPPGAAAGTLSSGGDAVDLPFARERAALLSVLPKLDGHIVLVSNETGLGVVPLGAASRRFCDEAGRLHQELAAECDRVTLMVAGLPVDLKS